MPALKVTLAWRLIGSAAVALVAAVSLAVPDAAAAVGSQSSAPRDASVVASGVRVERAVKARARWHTCSHLAPWNRVNYRGGRGATVVKVRRTRCRGAARVLRRSRVTRAGVVRVRGWRCRKVGGYSYGGSYSKCARRYHGRRQQIRIMVGW